MIKTAGKRSSNDNVTNKRSKLLLYFPSFAVKMKPLYSESLSLNDFFLEM